MRAVFSQRRAMRLKRLSLPTACSMRARRNDRTNAALAGAVAIGFGVVTFVGDGGARQNIGSDVEQEFEVAAVAGFAPGQMEGERQAVEVDLEVDFHGKEDNVIQESLKCNEQIFGVEENLARGLVAEYLSGARVKFILEFRGLPP